MKEVTLEDKKKLILQAVEIINNTVVNISNVKRILDLKGIQIDKEGKVIKQNLPFLIQKRGISFLVENKEEYSNFTKEIFPLYSESNFSRKYVKLFIQCLTADILKKGVDLVRQEPNEVIDIFNDFFQEQIVLIPIEGIEMEVKNLEIGNIVLRKMDEDLTQDITTKMKNYAISSPFLKETSAEYEIDFINKSRDMTFAEFRTFAGDDTAIERAEKECEKVVDLLQYAAAAFHIREDNVSINQGIKSKNPYKALTMGAEINSYHLHLDYSDWWYNLKITESNIKSMKEIGIFKVSDILKCSHKLNDFSKSLIRAIHWFANSQKQTEIENEFLGLMICLEILLSPNKNDPLTQTIAEETTIIITRGIKDDDIIEYRRKLKNKIRNLYDKRSNMVHGGSRSIGYEDINCLREVSLTLINHMIRLISEFKDKSLNTWIEEQKFKGF